MKGFVWLTVPHHHSSLKKVRTGTQARWEPGGKSWCRGHGGVLPILACSACFLIESKTTTHHGLGPPPLIINWENVWHLDLIEAFLQLRLLSPWWLLTVSSRHTKSVSRVARDGSAVKHFLLLQAWFEASIRRLTTRVVIWICLANGKWHYLEV